MTEEAHDPRPGAAAAKRSGDYTAILARFRAMHARLLQAGVRKDHVIDDLVTLFVMRAVCAGASRPVDPWVQDQAQQRWHRMSEQPAGQRLAALNELVMFLAGNAPLHVSRCFHGYAPVSTPEAIEACIEAASHVHLTGFSNQALSTMLADMVEHDSLQLTSRNHLTHLPNDIARVMAQVASPNRSDHVVVQEMGPGNLFGATTLRAAADTGQTSNCFGLIDRAINQRVAAAFALLSGATGMAGMVERRVKPRTPSATLALADMPGPQPLMETARLVQPGGRFAAVVDDAALSYQAAKDGSLLRFLNVCRPIAILRFPVGAFHIRRKQRSLVVCEKRERITQQPAGYGPWVFDLRSNMPTFDRTRQLTDRAMLSFTQAFEQGALCNDPSRLSDRWLRVSNTSVLLGRLV